MYQAHHTSYLFYFYFYIFLFFNGNQVEIYSVSGHEYSGISSVTEIFLFEHGLITLNLGCWRDLRWSWSLGGFL